MNFNLDTKVGMANSIAWLNAMLGRLKDGGMWQVPRSGTVFVIDHKKKVATKLVQVRPDPSLDQVFEAAGWEVL